MAELGGEAGNGATEGMGGLVVRVFEYPVLLAAPDEWEFMSLICFCDVDGPPCTLWALARRGSTCACPSNGGAPVPARLRQEQARHVPHGGEGPWRYLYPLHPMAGARPLQGYGGAASSLIFFLSSFPSTSSQVPRYLVYTTHPHRIIAFFPDFLSISFSNRLSRLE